MHQQWCKDNPARCEEVKARHEKMKEACKADPAKCEQRREGGRKDRSDAFCAKNPDKCDGEPDDDEDFDP